MSDLQASVSRGKGKSMGGRVPLIAARPSTASRSQGGSRYE